MSTLFFYNKEDIISLGANEEDLNNLNYIGINDAYDDVNNNNGANGYLILKTVFDEKMILSSISKGYVNVYGGFDCYIYKIADNIFGIVEQQFVPVGPIIS